MSSVTTPVSFPTRLSPSRAKDFVQCPKLFYYKTILGRTTPQTIATAKGTLAHTAFERLFDAERTERTPEHALAVVRPGWQTMVDPLRAKNGVPEDSVEAEIRNATNLWRDDIEAGSSREASLLRQAEEYRALFEADSKEEAAFLLATENVVANYFDIERPWNFDPVGRELHLEATVGDVTLHGFIDRLDHYTTESGEERWVISDYKTGKVPQARYLDESFFAMKVYALLLARTRGVMPHSLRLLYVGAKKPEAIQVLEVNQHLLEITEKKMNHLWAEIVQSNDHDVWETKTGPLCNWCHFKPECPAWQK